MALGEWQTESETFGEVVNLGEGLIEQFVSIAGQSYACVLYGEENGGGVLRDAESDMLAVGILGGIAEQFADRTHQIEVVAWQQSCFEVGQCHHDGRTGESHHRNVLLLST